MLVTSWKTIANFRHNQNRKEENINYTEKLIKKKSFKEGEHFKKDNQA